MTVQTRHSTYSFAQFLNARSATIPSFAPDGRRLAFVSDITGVPQLWAVGVESGWPDQLTFTADRVMEGKYSHHTDDILVGMDHGGDERQQIFLLRDGIMYDVAVDPSVMHSLGPIAPDDRKVAYSSNRRHAAHFDVYVSDLDGSNAQCVYEQDGSNFAVDWSPDGRALLVQRRTGALDSELFLLDLDSGQARHLTPHDPPVRYEQAHFAPDGASIYLLTDAGSEFMRFARMELASGVIEFLTPDDHDIDWLALSEDGSRAALVTNVEGYGAITARSLDTDDAWTPSGLPDGVALRPSWSRDGASLAFTFTAPAYNPNIWVWNLETDICRQVTFATSGGIPQETFVSPRLVRYRSFDGLEIPSFLYLPDVERPPVVINVHGGPEGQAQPVFSPVTQYFVNHGYAVLTPNVRGSTGYGRTYTHLDDVEKRMDSVADLEATVHGLRESGLVDGDRIAVMGGSYGGFMVLSAITTYPELWAAAVDIVGIADFETFFRNTSAYRRHWRIPEYGDPETHADLFRRISPIYKVDRIEAPLMVIHGDNDPRVPLNEAEQIVSALEARGRPVEFLHFADEGHGIIKLANKLIAYPAIGEFLDRYLGASA